MKIFAHRGASAYAPENTLESFALAAKMGPDGIELDVQRTRDGELVVCHDETIDRTSDGHGWLKDYTLEELRALHFNKTHPEYKDARIPTLREVYELMRPTGLLINVELKTGIFTYDGIEEQAAYLTREMKMERTGPLCRCGSPLRGPADRGCGIRKKCCPRGCAAPGDLSPDGARVR